MRKIIVAGFSGVGKSSLLKKLRETPKLTGFDRLDDLDDLILEEVKVYKSIQQLVENLGWEKFRLLERQRFEAWIKEEGGGVLVLGGGALSPVLWNVYKNSRRLKFCHLWASFETCWKRLNSSLEQRPLLQVGKIQLEQIYKERMLIFNQIEWKIENETTQDFDSIIERFLEKIS